MYSVEWAGFRPPFLLFFGCIPPGARLASPGLRLSRSEESQVEEPDVEPQQVHAPVPPEPPIESAELQQPQESELQVGGSRIQGLKKIRRKTRGQLLPYPILRSYLPFQV